MSFADVTDAVGTIPPIDFPAKVGATAPANPSIGTLWLDTNGNVLKVWASPGLWIAASSGSSTSSSIPTPPGPDMFLKSGTSGAFSPIWSDLCEGGTF